MRLFDHADVEYSMLLGLREKIFKNYALKSMDEVRAKLRQAVLYIERSPELVRSITSFPYMINSL